MCVYSQRNRCCGRSINCNNNCSGKSVCTVKNELRIRTSVGEFAARQLIFLID